METEVQSSMNRELRSFLILTVALCITYVFLQQIFLVAVGLIALYKLADAVLRWPRVPDIHDKYVLITGTSSGLGRHCVKYLDRLGCHVLACSRSEAGEQELRRQCSDRLRLIRLDVTDPESIRRVLDQVRTVLPEGRGLWGLVNNAAVSGPRGRFEWLTADDFRETNETNLYGLIDLTATLLPLVKRERGRVVNISSLAGRMVLPFAVPYCVSKFAVECLTDAWRISLKQYGVGVSVIEPAGYATAINSTQATQESLDKTWDSVPVEIKREFGEDYFRLYCNNCLACLPKPETLERLDEVAKLYEDALFSRFPRARYVTNACSDVILAVPFLPEWLQDRIIGAAFPVFNALPEVLRRTDSPPRCRR